MRTKLLTWAGLGAVLLMALPAAPRAQSVGRFSGGVVVWRHDTGVTVDHASDFDGTDRTADVAGKDWEAKGSGVGLRGSYEFPALLTVFGEIGLNQTTVRDEDVTDPARDVNTLGLDDGFYFSLGGRAWNTFTPESNAFWSGGLELSVVSSSLDEDVNVHWGYDETNLMVDGRAGVLVRNIGLYGGLRFSYLDASLEETDTSNAPGQQARTQEFSRDGKLDVLLGAETRSEWLHGFFQFEMGGTLGVALGLSMGI